MEQLTKSVIYAEQFFLSWSSMLLDYLVFQGVPVHAQGVYKAPLKHLGYKARYKSVAVTYSYLKHWIPGVLLWGVDHLQQHFLQMFEGRVELLGLPQLWYPQDEQAHCMARCASLILDLDLHFPHNPPVKMWVSKLKKGEREGGRGVNNMCFIHTRISY